MANQHLLINLTLLVFFMCISLLIVVQLTDASWNNLVKLKVKYLDRFGDYNGVNYATNNFFSDFGFTGPSGSTLNVKLLFRTAQSTSLPINTNRNNTSETGINFKGTNRRKATSTSGEIEGKTLNPNQSEPSTVKNISDKSKNVTACSRHILLWCDDTVHLNGSFFCEESGCQLNITRSVDVSDVKKAEAVIFYHYIEKPWDELIRSRPLGQIWIFFSRESPRNCRFCLPPKSYGNVFNISLTYLTDSDMVVPYGQFIPFDETEIRRKRLEPTYWAANRSKTVLWVASNCEKPAWDRTGFVKHLAEHTDVDIYGRCGTLTCPKTEKDHCLGVFRQYKFYLALENSFCRDYITEKVWRNSFESNLVPIVFGANRKDYEKALPPNSFIFAEDFNSTRQLGRFLEDLSKNETRYGEYFRWKEMGETARWSKFLTFKPDTFCRLLTTLIRFESKRFDDKFMSKRESIEYWWKSSCRKAANFNFTDSGGNPYLQ